MKLKVPTRIEKEELRKKSPYERERYIREIIRETISMSPYGVTTKDLKEGLHLDHKTVEKHLSVLTAMNEICTQMVGGATTLYLSNIAGMKEGSKKAISLDGREYDISIIENREGEFVMIRQIEKGDTKGGIIIPKGKFKEFVEFQRRCVERNE